ncbi:hypothetical protein NX059_005494 [Plenodomus lindquistii]|nr:hypothetical protein NX059_005494 [Plenodomus lindquistii]
MTRVSADVVLGLVLDSVLEVAGNSVRVAETVFKLVNGELGDAPEIDKDKSSMPMEAPWFALVEEAWLVTSTEV